MTHSSPPPDVSVIIPTYNRADYISAAIDSVLQQTLPRVEVIVADDGSTDDTEARVRAYGDRVKYIRVENGGSAHARNAGMAVARGKYLAFLDSDDMLYPYALEVEKRVLDQYPDVGMVYAEMSGFDDAGFFDRYHLKTYHDTAYRRGGLSYDQLFPRRVPLAEVGVPVAELAAEDPTLPGRCAYIGNIFDHYLTSIVLFTNNMLLRRQVVGAVGIRNEQVKYWEELDYTLRISRGHTVCFMDIPTYKLRYHPGQISTTVRSDGRYVWLRKQQILLRVVKRQALADSSYYERNRARIDRCLANLHRAVAVPLMVSSGRGASTPRARMYLRRCGRYGHPERLLWALSFCPLLVRKVGVSAMQSISRLSRRRASAAARSH